MKRAEHLLTIAVEEAVEIAHRGCKILRFGPTEVQPGQSLNNSERFMEEFVQLSAVVGMLNEEGVLAAPAQQKGDLEIQLMVDDKKTRIERYLAYSEECGTLERSE